MPHDDADPEETDMSPESDQGLHDPPAAHEPPAWRVAVKQLAGALDAAGIRYCIISGAATALHGVSIPVKDIDVELDRADIYRLNDIFVAHVVLPVQHRESERWRSHFGRFDFDGVTVEFMADLERREGDGWARSGVSTETFVDVDGVSVRTAWLEEEFLAYIRRGRLERAALMLPHCNHARLLALLRGEVKTVVL